MFIVKYNKKTKDIRCKCKGQVMVYGTATHQLPLGFGFHPGSNKFAIDVVRYKGWIGDCMECRKKVLAYSSRRIITKYPRKINKKISSKIA